LFLLSLSLLVQAVVYVRRKQLSIAMAVAEYLYASVDILDEFVFIS
jgi:hypothetical protein